MEAEQYKGLLFLVSGISVFVIMLLSLKILSRKQSRGRSVVADDRWMGAEDLEIVDIITETPNVKSFKLKRANGKPFPSFRGGQFLSFQIENKANVTRSYSLSSPEQNRDVVQISVKRLPDGYGSSWFHQLKVGDKVKAYAPSGHFVDAGETNQERVFVAGGIGITPILSIVYSNLENAKPFQMTLFYGVRTKADLAFHKLLEHFASRHSQFKYYPILSHEPNWPGDKGYLTFEFIQSKLGSIKDQVFYICGPEAMSNPLLEKLEAHAVPEENVHIEQFVSADAIDDSQIPERHVWVRWLGQKYEYQGRSNLLSFLESQGQVLPYACRSGVCGTCKCRISGQFKMLTKAGLTRKEQKEGLALACVSFPESDVEITLVD